MANGGLSMLYESQGQSLWLDNLSRELLHGGKLATYVRDYGIRGVTSNPTIFQKAIAGSEDYKADIRRLKGEYDDIEVVYEHLVLEDIRQACDMLRPIYDQSHGEDGWVSWEESPGIAHNATASVAAAERLRAMADRPNLLIKIPSTKEGLEAFEQLIGRGVSVNVTLMFSLRHVREAFAAYKRGLEALKASGGAVSRVRAVASLFLSRVDTLVDKKLEEIGTEEALALRGKAAVAMARQAYRIYEEAFKGEDFAPMAQHGARGQYMLWASTGTKNPEYSDLLYVENLIAPETINTMPNKTLEAFADHGTIHSSLKPGMEESDRVWAALDRLGIDMDGQIGEQLQDEGVDSFQKSFDDLLEEIRRA
ncbi:MAG: transaldolase [Halothiobacillaceae bacterium]